MVGAKWPVIIVALILASWVQWRFFLALCSLFLLTVYTGLSIKTSAGYNFVNIWMIVANLFAACGLWRLWKVKKPSDYGSCHRNSADRDDRCPGAPSNSSQFAIPPT